jgi:hypothetical protein
MRAQRSEAAARPTDTGAGLARGVCRGLYHLGYNCLTEFKLTSRRRVDVIGLDAGGVVLIVEVKSSLEDFRADRKWPEYLAYCDYFYFAVPVDFPRAALPEDCGLLVADFYGAALAREAPLLKLNATRRRVQTLRFAQTAAARLTRFTDPDPSARHGLGPDRGLGPDLGPDLNLGHGASAGPRLF